MTGNGNTYIATPGDAGATTFVAGQNYLCITNVTDASGNLSFTYNHYGSHSEADINGIQLQLFPSGVDTWVGNTSTNFSGLNWTGTNNPPVAGDALVFGPAGSKGTTLNADQAAGITYAGITFTASASTYTINGTNGITLTGGITNNSGNVETLKFPINCPAGVTIAANTNGITLSGTISGTGGITVVGGAVHWNNVMLTLAGTNTYTGPTVVSQGLLELAGSLTSTSAVTVAFGGMLQCSNTIAGPVAVTGLISAHGYTLNTGPETWYGSSYENLLELACGYCVQMSGNFTGTAGKDWDLLNINGALNIAATSDQPFVIRVEVPIFDPLFDNTRDYTWRIATASGGISGFDASKFLVTRWANSKFHLTRSFLHFRPGSVTPSCPSRPPRWDSAPANSW